jgi:hypothetical protein
MVICCRLSWSLVSSKRFEAPRSIQLFIFCYQFFVVGEFNQRLFLDQCSSDRFGSVIGQVVSVKTPTTIFQAPFTLRMV